MDHHVSSGVLRTETRIDDVLNRLISNELLDGRHCLSGKLADSRVHNKCAFLADLNGNVAAVTNQHVDVALYRPDVDLTIVGIRIDSSAGNRGRVWERPNARDCIGVGRARQLLLVVRIEGFGSTQGAQQRNVVLIGVLAKIWILPEQIIRNLVIGPAEDLFAVITGVKPRFRISGRAAHIGVPDQRFRQIDRIGKDRNIRDAIAVPDEMLHKRRLITHRHAVRAYVIPFEVSSVNRQNIAFVLTRRET